MQVVSLIHGGFGVADIAASCSTGNMDNPRATSLASALKSGHLSVLEHTYFSFRIEGISRACAQQLRTHRIASFTQESQRYCEVDTDTDWYVVPPAIEADEMLLEEYRMRMRYLALHYQEMLRKGISKEDARYVLPNACKTKVVMTVNARAFIEQAQKRLCNKAQWEIRKLYGLLKNAIDYRLPEEALKLCAPPCKAYNRCPEANPCNKPVLA